MKINDLHILEEKVINKQFKIKKILDEECERIAHDFKTGESEGYSLSVHEPIEVFEMSIDYVTIKFYVSLDIEKMNCLMKSDLKDICFRFFIDIFDNETGITTINTITIHNDHKTSLPYCVVNSDDSIDSISLFELTRYITSYIKEFYEQWKNVDND